MFEINMNKDNTITYDLKKKKITYKFSAMFS